MDLITLSLAIVVGSIILYWYFDTKKKLNYWQDRGVDVEEPVFFFGNSLPQILGKRSSYENFYHVYKKFEGKKLAGTYGFTRANLLIRDINLLEKILVKDFQYFSDHNPEREDRSLINLGLFSLTGNHWRGLRNKITPTFTSGKLKFMFDQLIPCADILVKNVGRHVKEDFEVREELMAYSIDVTSNVIFGIELKEGAAKGEYKKHALAIFDVNFIRFIALALQSNFPKFAKMFGIKFLKRETSDYFRKVINDTFTQRKESNYQRNDYVQLLLNLKEKGHLEIRQKDPDDDYLKTSELDTSENIEITDDLLAAQAFQFLSAGFDPLYNTMQFFLYELSKNCDVQDRVRLEVKECLAKNSGYTYKAVKDMVYLEQCLQETLRLYPIVPFLVRVCLKDYLLDDGLLIEKGTGILVSLFGIQRDPNYFPEPEKFDPDRFHPDSPKKGCTYLPFGDGPRVCIGMRFAMMEMKLGMAKLIENYKFSLSPKTEQPIKFSKRSFFLKADKVFLKVERAN